MKLEGIRILDLSQFLRLGEGGYRWRFVPVAGKTFTDAGSTACHGKPGS